MEEETYTEEKINASNFLYDLAVMQDNKKRDEAFANELIKKATEALSNMKCEEDAKFDIESKKNSVLKYNAEEQTYCDDLYITTSKARTTTLDPGEYEIKYSDPLLFSFEKIEMKNDNSPLSLLDSFKL